MKARCGRKNLRSSLDTETKKFAAVKALRDQLVPDCTALDPNETEDDIERKQREERVEKAVEYMMEYANEHDKAPPFSYQEHRAGVMTLVPVHKSDKTHDEKLMWMVHMVSIAIKWDLDLDKHYRDDDVDKTNSSDSEILVPN